MSDRGHFRGGSRGGGQGGRGGRGGGRGGGASQQPGQPHEKPKKENILDLTKYVNKQINVKFNGGRESTFASFSGIWNDLKLICGPKNSCRYTQGLRPVDESGIGRC